eukprot:SAG22_NODE_1480_length_4326_cov_32.114739_3_plen_491_part_00
MARSGSGFLPNRRFHSDEEEDEAGHEEEQEQEQEQQEQDDDDDDDDNEEDAAAAAATAPKPERLAGAGGQEQLFPIGSPRKLVGKRIAYKFVIEGKAHAWIGCLVKSVRGDRQLLVHDDDDETHVVKVLESTRAPDAARKQGRGGTYCWYIDTDNTDEGVFFTKDVKGCRASQAAGAAAGELEYLISWWGYDSDADTWEPAASTPKELVEEWAKRQMERANSNSTAKPKAGGLQPEEGRSAAAGLGAAPSKKKFSKIVKLTQRGGEAGGSTRTTSSGRATAAPKRLDPIAEAERHQRQRVASPPPGPAGYEPVASWAELSPPTELLRCNRWEPDALSVLSTAQLPEGVHPAAATAAAATAAADSSVHSSTTTSTDHRRCFIPDEVSRREVSLAAAAACLADDTTARFVGIGRITHPQHPVLHASRAKGFDGPVYNCFLKHPTAVQKGQVLGEYIGVVRTDAAVRADEDDRCARQTPFDDRTCVVNSTPSK